MKKQIKSIIIAVLILSFAFSLCGCDGLDELKASQAFKTADGNITWNNALYIKTIAAEDVPNFSENSDSDIYVTEPDVPVLLSAFYAFVEDSYYSVGYNKKLIFDYENIYCREDFIDEFNKTIKENKLDNYFSYNFDYYESDDASMVLFKEEENEKIKNIFSSKKIKNKKLFQNLVYEGDNISEFGKCSKDKILCETENVIIRYESNLYIAPIDFYYVDDFDDIDHTQVKNLFCYKVPEEYRYIFQDLVNKYDEEFSY